MAKSSPDQARFPSRASARSVHGPLREQACLVKHTCVALYKLSNIYLSFSSFFLPLVPILKNNILTIQGFANSRAAVNNSNFTDISTLQSLLKHKDSTASLSTTEADDQLFAMIQLEKSMLLKTKASSSSPPPRSKQFSSSGLKDYASGQRRRALGDKTNHASNSNSRTAAKGKLSKGLKRQHAARSKQRQPTPSSSSFRLSSSAATNVPAAKTNSVFSNGRISAALPDAATISVFEDDDEEEEEQEAASANTDSTIKPKPASIAPAPAPAPAPTAKPTTQTGQHNGAPHSHSTTPPLPQPLPQSLARAATAPSSASSSSAAAAAAALLATPHSLSARWTSKRARIKVDGKGLKISIQGKDVSQPGLLVDAVMKGGPSDGVLTPRDRIVKIGDVDITTMVNADAMAILGAAVSQCHFPFNCHVVWLWLFVVVVHA